MGAINLDNTGSGGAITLSSDGTSLLLGGSSIGGGGASAYTIDTKTDNYTAVAGDLGKLINFTSISADKTLTLTAAATLGAGWFCYVRYSAIASGAAGYAYKVIIDPNGSETIDGEATRNMKGGQTFQILCDGSNFHILSSDDSRAFSHNVFYGGVGTYGQSLAQPEASGAYAIALGGAALSSGTGSVALGYDSKSTGSNSFAGPKSTATGQYSVSLGNGSPAGNYNGARGAGSIAIGQTVSNASGSLAIGQYANATGANASAIGHSLASGSHSFAAGIASNSSSYGATGANSIAMGYHAKANAASGIGIGGSSIATGSNSVALGGTNYGGPQAIGAASVVIGQNYSLSSPSANGPGSISLQDGSSTNGNASNSMAVQGGSTLIKGQYAYAGGESGSTAQTSTYVLKRATTDATITTLTTERITSSTTPSATNQIILRDESAVSFSGTVVVREDATDGDDYAGWEIKGVIMREGAASATTLGVGIVNSLYHTAGLANAVVTLSADTSNGGLKVQVTGIASTNLRWVAAINTSEVRNS